MCSPFPLSLSIPITLQLSLSGMMMIMFPFSSVAGPMMARFPGQRSCTEECLCFLDNGTAFDDGFDHLGGVHAGVSFAHLVDGKERRGVKDVDRLYWFVGES
jgi:hypothetical protein